MRVVAGLIGAVVMLPAMAVACDLAVPKRQPTIAEQVAGLDEMYGGTVVGYVLDDGTRLMGPMPKRCLTEGEFRWWDSVPASCQPYLDTEAALFRVDTSIVGPAAGEVVSEFMTWGDGDCNIDFVVGEKWLIAGFWYTQRLKGPIREDEVKLLKRLAAHPKFDWDKLYR